MPRKPASPRGGMACASIGPNCLGVMAPAAKLNASFAARGAQARRSRPRLAIGRRRGGPRRMGGAAQCRLLRRRVPRRQGRRRFQRLPRLLRIRPVDARDPALRRIDQRCAQVHVRGARRFAREAGRRDQVGPARAGREGGRNPHRRACGVGRGLRRGVPARRALARARSRPALRGGGNARPAAALPGKAARDPDQRRRRRRARRRPAHRSRRDARDAFASRALEARCSAAADLVARQSGRHRRRCRCGADTPPRSTCS